MSVRVYSVRFTLPSANSLPPANDAVAFKNAESRREHGARDAGELALEFSEACGTGAQAVEDVRLPASAKDVERNADRTSSVGRRHAPTRRHPFHELTVCKNGAESIVAVHDCGARLQVSGSGRWRGEGSSTWPLRPCRGSGSRFRFQAVRRRSSRQGS